MSMGIQKAIELAERQEDLKKNPPSPEEQKRIDERTKELDREREELVRNYQAGDDLR